MSKYLGKLQYVWLMVALIITTLRANSADDKLTIILLVFPEIGFDISCKLSSKETICMKYQSLFSGKNKKNISKCLLLKFLPSMQSVVKKSGQLQGA